MAELRLALRVTEKVTHISVVAALQTEARRNPDVWMPHREGHPRDAAHAVVIGLLAPATVAHLPEPPAGPMTIASMAGRTCFGR